MKRLFSIVLVISMMLCLTAFAQEEFSNSAEVDYDYNENYDANPEQKEKTTGKYDDISTSYDESFDESDDVDYGNEYIEEPDPVYDTPNDINTNVAVKSDVISVFVNDEKVVFDVNPMLINNRTMVPVRAIFEALGATVTWDNDTQTAKGVLDDVIVEITIGSPRLLKNGKHVELDSPAVIVSGRTMVPVRAIAESYDCDVTWYGDTQVVEILK